MASSIFMLPTHCAFSPNLLPKQTLPIKRSHFLSSNSSLLISNNPYALPSLRLPKPTSPNSRPCGPKVFAVQSNLAKIIQTAWNVGKDGVEAGTNLVPDFVPKPVARIGVTVVALLVAQFVLRSFLSTAFFILGTMGLVYFLFLALNKDQELGGGGGGGGGGSGGGGGGGSGGGGGGDEKEPLDDPVEQARRIMEKYK